MAFFGVRPGGIRWTIAAAVLFLAALFLSLPAFADEEIQLTLKDHRFHPDQAKVRAGVAVRLVIHNEDSTAEEFESRDLKQEKLVPAGKKVILQLRPLKPGSYVFFGEFHGETARGRLVVE